jgi:glycosyltransferase involved in cell wall biosynthesis
VPSPHSPLCSIIIPARNCRDYLPTALASVDLQHVDDLEILVVDDGSTDGTAEWLAGDRRARAPIVLLETGGVGVSRARNAALARARGTFIAFLDADDLWWPDKLRRQLAFHRENPSVGLSFTDYMHMTPDGLTHGTCFAFWGEAWGVDGGRFAVVENAECRLLATNVIGTSATVVRRDVMTRLGGFSTDCKSAEDWDLWLRMAAAAPVACSRMVGMTYLMRPNGETSAKARRIEAMHGIIARYDGDRRPDFVAARRQAKARLATADAEHLAGQGRHLSAARHHLQALMAVPSLRTLKAAAAAGLDAAAAKVKQGKAA